MILPISIHAPLTGSDRASGGVFFCRFYFNPRSPYGERLIELCIAIAEGRFQSTLPLRGATYASCLTWTPWLFQSTLPLRGATWICCWVDHPAMISIHAPLTGSDCYWIFCGTPSAIFQSTLPLRGATGKARFFSRVDIFQSTLPLRGATANKILDLTPIEISIHAPLTGSDAKIITAIQKQFDFNPRSPYGERLGIG